jgi:hypothetical protein
MTIRSAIPALALALAALVACGAEEDAVPDDPATAGARDAYPTVLDLSVGLFSNTCSPNQGVCHNRNNYPDLHTTGNLVSLVDAPCNVEIPDPMHGWDACEAAPDRLVTAAGATDVAWIERRSPESWRIGLRDAAATTARSTFAIETSAGEPLFEVFAGDGVELHTTAGAAEADIVLVPDDEGVLPELFDVLIESIVGGDPNRNGIWGAAGAAARAALIAPGSLERSYLWGRITGTVPGTRMPLANGPVTRDQYIALACWIQSTGASPRATDAIQYAGCDTSAVPAE